VRWIVHLLALVSLSLTLVGCTTSVREEIPFTVIAEGDTAADYPDQQGIVIGSLAEWEELWSQLRGYTIPQPAVPELEFTQYTVLAVFAGEKRSGGYTVQVERVIQTDQAVIVRVTETAPGTDQMTTAQITYPYQVVKIPHTSLLVRFDF